jgi:hypothetical protein
LLFDDLLGEVAPTEVSPEKPTGEGDETAEPTQDDLLFDDLLDAHLPDDKQRSPVELDSSRGASFDEPVTPFLASSGQANAANQAPFDGSHGDEKHIAAATKLQRFWRKSRTAAEASETISGSSENVTPAIDLRVHAVNIQAIYLAYLARTRYNTVRKTTIRIQAFWRFVIACAVYRRTIKKVIRVQAVARGFIARKKHRFVPAEKEPADAGRTPVNTGPINANSIMALLCAFFALYCCCTHSSRYSRRRTGRD